MTIKDGEVIEASDLLTTFLINQFSNYMNLIWNASYIGFNAKLNYNSGVSSLWNKLYWDNLIGSTSNGQIGVESTYQMSYDSTNDYYYTEDLSAIGSVYMVITADSVGTIEDYDCNKHNIENSDGTASNDWIIYSDSGNSVETQRAEILACMFVSNDIVNECTNVTEIALSAGFVAASGGGEDIGRRMHYATMTAGVGAGSSCFLPDSFINMSDGSYKKIKDIKKGDLVKSFNEETKQVVNSTVNNIQVVKHDNVHELHFEDGKLLKPTANHPFYVSDKGWATISGIDEMNMGCKKLEVGDKLLCLVDDGFEEVKVKDIVAITGEYDTYNFLDMEYGTFLVDDIVTHNSYYTKSYDGVPSDTSTNESVSSWSEVGANNGGGAKGWWYLPDGTQLNYATAGTVDEYGTDRTADEDLVTSDNPVDLKLKAYGGKSGSSCFLGKQLLTYADGSQKPIEKAKEGDEVLVWDEENDEIKSGIVHKIQVKKHTNLHELHLVDGKVLYPTANHPFWIKNKGWATIDGVDEMGLDVAIMTEEDYVYTSDKKWVKIDKIVKTPGEFTTYNLIDMNYRTFIVDKVVVHNTYYGHANCLLMVSGGCTISWTLEAGNSSGSNIDFTADHSIPVFTAAGTLASYGLYTSNIIFNDVATAVKSFMATWNTSVDGTSTATMYATSDNGSTWEAVTVDTIHRFAGAAVGSNFKFKWEVVRDGSDLSIADRIMEIGCIYNLNAGSS